MRTILIRLAAVLILAAPAVSPAAPATAATVGAVRAAVDNAIYTWWAQPVAVNDGDHTWIGSIARLGTVRVSRVHPATGAVRTVEMSRTNRPDDHNAPTIAFEAGQPNLVVFYTGHNYDNVMRYRTVDRTTLAVGPERQLTFSGDITYAQVLRTGRRLVLLTRVAISTWRYRVSDDFGTTWGPEQMLVDARGYGQVYVVAKPEPGNANRNLLAFYGHPVNSPYRNVEFARIDLTSGSVERLNGQVLGNLYSTAGPGLRPGQMDPAITPSAGYKVRLLDIGVVGGRPTIAYAVWNGSTGAATYKTKMFLDGAWSTPPWAVPSGDPFGYDPATHYLGGTVIGRADRLYTARQDNSSGTWHVEQWRWSESQRTFVLDRELLRDARLPLVRPYVPARAGQTEVIVQRLVSYTGITSYDADVLVL
ncbi:hypothetical protein ACN27F_31990 [Solwaraspora sp. WMMB335]|uniref:hypothetical protein n=1 Tax=Solwaraspora sp. WMMB335 TaxID=3404118 RepID=UPI003B9243C7